MGGQVGLWGQAFPSTPVFAGVILAAPPFAFCSYSILLLQIHSTPKLFFHIMAT